MSALLLMAGAAAFGLMALSDWLCVLRGRAWGGRLFAAGCLLLAGATAGLLAGRGAPRPASLPWWALAAGMLALLLYTLLGALPAGGSHLMPPTEPALRPLVDTGVYALCRHPGVLWLGGFYLFAWCAAGGWPLLAAFVLFTGLDVAYVFWQDRVIFPVSIEHYRLYQKTTPFLVPSAASLRRCLRRRESGEENTDPEGKDQEWKR